MSATYRPRAIAIFSLPRSMLRSGDACEMFQEEFERYRPAAAPISSLSLA